MTFLSEVSLGPINNRLYFGGDPDYDPDCMDKTFTTGVSRAKEQSIGT